MTRAFRFTGRDGTGTAVRGVVHAESDAQARSRLREQGVFVTSLSSRARRSPWPLATQSLDPEAVAAFTFHLAGLIDSGVPLLRGLEVLHEQTDNPRLQAVIADLQESIQAGESLSVALGRHADAFSPLYIGVIRTGEVAGTLDQALQRLADHLEREIALNQKIRSMLVYPAFVLVLAVAVLGMFVAFVVPAFERVYRSAGAALPLPTQVLVAGSRVVRHAWVPAGVVAALAVWTTTRAGVHRAMRKAAERLVLRMPRVGGLARMIQVSRFVRTFGAMYASGVPVLVALSVTSEAMTDPTMRDAVERLGDEIQRGRRLADSMRTAGLFPPMVYRMVAMGEESGQLDAMLQRAGNLLEREIDYAIRRLVTLAEPVLTLVLGGLVGGILLALYLPIFGLTRLIAR